MESKNDVQLQFSRQTESTIWNTDKKNLYNVVTKIWYK